VFKVHPGIPHRPSPGTGTVLHDVGEPRSGMYVFTQKLAGLGQLPDAGSFGSPHWFDESQLSLNRLLRHTNVCESQTRGPLCTSGQWTKSAHQPVFVPLSLTVAPSQEQSTHLWLFGSPAFRWQILLEGQSASLSHPSTQWSATQREPFSVANAPA
jgi:hypothetical protein